MKNQDKRALSFIVIIIVGLFIVSILTVAGYNQIPQTRLTRAPGIFGAAMTEYTMDHPQSTVGYGCYTECWTDWLCGDVYREATMCFEEHPCAQRNVVCTPSDPRSSHCAIGLPVKLETFCNTYTHPQVKGVFKAAGL
ncbi:MAG: hypothetical protein ABIH52_00515 [Candidatus Aenigmatarchaeota archaeon]